MHWRGDLPLSDTLEAFQQLKRNGDIRDHGVSNFDVADMEEWLTLPGGNETVTNQVLYNLLYRGIDWDLLPLCRERRIPIMAYSPIGNDAAAQKRMLGHPAIRSIASRHEVAPAQVALAWLLRNPDMVIIPKAVQPEHIKENRAALEFELTTADLDELDQAFAPPKRKVPLETA